MQKTEITTTKNVAHPLEDLFDIEPGTTLSTRTEQKTDLIEHIDYDEKDTEIEDQMQEVFDKAMSGYENIQDDLEDVEGKYKARMMEVGVQHLKMALDAAQAKARMKELKDKVKGKSSSGGNGKTVNNNLIISREELLRTLSGDDDVIDVTPEK